jgi:hypothetical protein
VVAFRAWRFFVTTSWKLCPSCEFDPDPRGPSACATCREINTRRPPLCPDLSDAHVDRVARKLFRAFDDANKGHEPLHDFDVMSECEYDGRPVIDNWRALARAAIQLGAVVLEEEVQP